MGRRAAVLTLRIRFPGVLPLLFEAIPTMFVLYLGRRCSTKRRKLHLPAQTQLWFKLSNSKSWHSSKEIYSTTSDCALVSHTAVPSFLIYSFSALVSLLEILRTHFLIISVSRDCSHLVSWIDPRTTFCSVKHLRVHTIFRKI